MGNVNSSPHSKTDPATAAARLRLGSLKLFHGAEMLAASRASGQHDFVFSAHKSAQIVARYFVVNRP
jgi:hypothetical protein